MTDEIRKRLEAYPENWPASHLKETFYITMDPVLRFQLEKHLTRLLEQLHMAGIRMREPETVRLIYEALSRLMSYDHTEYPEGEGDLRYSYAGGITSGKAVCMGVAEMFTMVACAMGLRAQTVIGWGGDPAKDGGEHAWNIVWVNGTPYHVDLTWDLSEYATARGGFKYYLKSDDYMRRHDHDWLPERCIPCPRSMPEWEIPRVNPEAVSFLCSRFEILRRVVNSDS